MINTLLLALLLPASARAGAPAPTFAAPLSEACENEINLLCRRRRAVYA